MEDGHAAGYVSFLWCLNLTFDYVTALPHATTEDDIYEGYFIPKGTPFALVYLIIYFTFCRLASHCQ